MVDEYFQEFETSLIKMNLHVNEESKIKWFVSGLRREIKDLVKLHEYTSLKKVFHLAIKVESHLLKTTFKNTHDDSFYNSSRKDATKVSTQNSPSNFCKETTSSQKVSTQNPSTPKSSTKTLKTKCFKCLSFEHIAANCPNKQPTKLNEVKQDQFTINNKSENEKTHKIRQRRGRLKTHNFSPNLSIVSLL